MEHKERLAKIRDDMRLDQAGTGSDDSSQSWAVRRVRQLDILKQLIQKKEAIGSDIAKCASQLDMFFNTASSELKVTLEYRSDLANGLTQLDKPHT
ncbi:hypothetical protein M8818_001684 [Zalaria obscura]|uniref:Uncharacterized protein n=1 Tax=Zalaria obscura TaxID=2024903 RepID=A0ACC3SJ32_9PEZI